MMVRGRPWPIVTAVRLSGAAAILIAIVATHLDVASRGPVNPFNLYGYFTVQSNLIGAGALLATASTRLARRAHSVPLGLFRALAATCLAIVGIVYAVLLAPLGVAGGVPVPWANTVLHIVSPILVTADWVLVGDRPRLPRARTWLILLYPAGWTGVVLIRGATDGWVPYPFLDPAQGYGVVALYCLAILVLFVGMSLAVLRISRSHGLVLRSNDPPVLTQAPARRER